MAQAPSAIFKIPTESPQPTRGRASRARKATAAQPKAASRVTGTETRAATRGGGDVIELEHGITVYPPREEGGRWRAVWQENGEQKQCESVSEEKPAAKLEQVKVRLGTRASNMLRPGADLIAHYLNLDRLPVKDRWSQELLADLLIDDAVDMRHLLLAGAVELAIFGTALSSSASRRT